MNFGIDGKRALVCGASRGLGFACAAALAKEGVAVTLVARDRGRLTDAAAWIGSEKAATHVVAADISTDIGRNAVLAACPAPDIVVTNAGGPPSGDFRALSESDWTAALEANFMSAVELIRRTVDGMIERGFGRIVTSPR